MKKLFLLFMLTFPVIVNAKKGFEPQIKASYELGVDQYSNQSFGAEVVLGYRLIDNFRLGIGAGIYWCKYLYEKAYYDYRIKHYFNEYRETASYIPLFVNCKCNFTHTSDWKPYMSFDLGYSFFNSASKYADKNKLGFFVKPAFGVDYSFGKSALFIEIGYKYQTRTFQETEMGFSQFTMSIGFQF